MSGVTFDYLRHPVLKTTAQALINTVKEQAGAFEFHMAGSRMGCGRWTFLAAVWKIDKE